VIEQPWPELDTSLQSRAKSELREMIEERRRAKAINR
jgi:hypothetical protein